MYNTSFMVGSVASPDYYYWQNGSQVSNESTGWGSIAQNVQQQMLMATELLNMHHQAGTTHYVPRI
jgi:hypothetical protein